MPTGYTAGVDDGTVTDFRSFALICARRFGATIMQRDEPMGAPPRLREVSEYAIKALAEADARISYLNAMSNADADVAAALACSEAIASREHSENECAQTRTRYNAMLAEVRSWEPPTPDHAGMKAFMIEQLNESIKWDCMEHEREAIPRLSGATWLATERQLARASRNRAETSLREERDRCEGSNRWITALYDSLADRVRSSVSPEA